jgi:hypothetical protein
MEGRLRFTITRQRMLRARTETTLTRVSYLRVKFQFDIGLLVLQLCLVATVRVENHVCAACLKRSRYIADQETE